ncbi:hypothetical protein, partial [Pediococcus damnosus]|uniref:hypothetical protein n=3 Tax=Lactobacillaceae TaxID=33958 RepID=UPI000704A964
HLHKILDATIAVIVGILLGVLLTSLVNFPSSINIGQVLALSVLVVAPLCFLFALVTCSKIFINKVFRKE